MKLLPEKDVEIGTWVKRGTVGIEDEYGIVVLTWHNAELGIKDCYVAFWGDSVPDPEKEKPAKPYVLRYAASSLIPIER